MNTRSDKIRAVGTVVILAAVLWLYFHGARGSRFLDVATIASFVGLAIVLATPRRVEIIKEVETIRIREVAKYLPTPTPASVAPAPKPYRPKLPAEPPKPDLSDPIVQLQNLERAKRVFRKSILNKGEATVFYAARDAVARSGRTVFAQVSLGEIIGVEDDVKAVSDDAFSAFNSKRVDILVCNTKGVPVLAIEHQGTGHAQGNALQRDAVKFKAYERAEIALLETHPGMNQAAYTAIIRDKLQSLPE